MRTRILTGFIIGTKLLHGTNRKSHGQDCGSLKKFEKQSQDFSATLVAIGCMIHLYVWPKKKTYIAGWSQILHLMAQNLESISHILCMTWLILGWHDVFIYDVRRSYVWHDSVLCVWHDSFKCVPWLIHMCVPWLIYVCDMTFSFVWHDVFFCVTWLTGARTHAGRGLAHSYVCHYAFTRVTWRLNLCDMTHRCGYTRGGGCRWLR